MTQIDCMLRTAELELDIYRRIVSYSIEDFLRVVPDPEILDSVHQLRMWQAINRRRHWLDVERRARDELLAAARRREVVLTPSGADMLAESSEQDAVG